MAEPFLGEIRIFSFNFPPKGWAFCNGQFLPINQNQALFSLMGTMYGGNGQTTFALPDLRGRAPIHVGGTFSQGQAGGQEFHTVTQSEMPQHIHIQHATSNAVTTNIPSTTAALGNSAPAEVYEGGTNYVAMSPTALTNVGGSQPHENRQPLIVLNFCVALQGIFPSQN